jgi:hypothetical protein
MYIKQIHPSERNQVTALQFHFPTSFPRSTSTRCFNSTYLAPHPNRHRAINFHNTYHNPSQHCHEAHGSHTHNSGVGLATKPLLRRQLPEPATSYRWRWDQKLHQSRSAGPECVFLPVLQRRRHVAVVRGTDLQHNACIPIPLQFSWLYNWARKRNHRLGNHIFEVVDPR